MTGVGAAAEIMADSTVVLTLRDGRTVTVEPEQRLLFGRSVGAAGAPVIGGSDQEGPFVAAFLHQDGLPADCWIGDIGLLGVERGVGIVIEGTLWPKSATFSSPGGIPAFGHEYPDGARFCFDATGRIASVVPH